MSIRKHVSKSGKVTFYVYVTGKAGAPVYVGKRGTKHDAQVLEAHERARRLRASPAEMDAPTTLDDVWARVLPSLSTRSVKQYTAQWSNLAPLLGRVRLVELTPLKVTAVREALLSGEGRRKPLGPGTVAFALRVLSIVLNKCVDEGWISRNPAAKSTRGLLTTKHVAGEEPAEQERLRFIPSRESMAKVLRAAPEGYARDLIAFGMFTGCRVGEVCAVDWRDVQLEARKLCIQRSVKGPTKSGKARWMPIQAQLQPMLKRRWLAQGRPERGHVFPELWPSRQVENRARRALYRALAKAGVGRYTSHEAFRHTFASHFVMAGGDIFRLAKYLGHSDVKITYAIYSHLAPGAFSDDEHRIELPPFDQHDAEVISLTSL